MNDNQSKQISYITGLRGIAIMMVVLFHLQPDCFANGFLGVDIFFVISGYFLFRNWDEPQKFSFSGFTKKKIIRIYPSLTILVLIAFISSIPFLYDAFCAREEFGKYALTSLFSASNLYFIKKSFDYFAQNSNLNPLLHTWYLSVLIQIYFIWAILNFVLQRFDITFRSICVFILALVSILYCFSYDIQQCFFQWWDLEWGQIRSISYYDTFGRLWQILAGGIAYLLPNHCKSGTKTTLTITGIILLCFAAFCNCKLPNWISIPVVFCTVLVIKYADNAFAKLALENKPIVFLGKISFSLYIIHFPIIVFYRKWERISPSLPTITALLLFSIFAAWIFWHLVETRKFRWRSIIILFTCGLLATGIALNSKRLGITWQQADISDPAYTLTAEHTTISDTTQIGFNEQLIQGNEGILYLLKDYIEPCPPILSLSGSKEKAQFVVIGDSNAQHFYAGFHELCKKRNLPGIQLTSIIFPKWNYHMYSSPSYCWTKPKADAFIKWLKNQPDIHTVVVSHLWEIKEKSPETKPTIFKLWSGHVTELTQQRHLQLIKDFCTELNRIGKHVVFLTPSPVFEASKDKPYIGRGINYTQWLKLRGWEITPGDKDDPFVLTKDKYMQLNRNVFQMMNQLEAEGYCKLLHIEKGIFKNGHYCGVQDGTLYSSDSTHITPTASISIMNEIADDFEQIIRQNKNSEPPCR